MAFAGKAAIVTGGGSGIGFQTSRHLLLAGVTKLAICDLSCSQEVLAKLQKESPKATLLFQKTDVTKRQTVVEAFTAVKQQFGYVDILVNSAGIFDEQNFERIFAVNVFGVINGTEVAVELMSKEKGGKGGIICNIASTVGLDCIVSQPYYNATKHAVMGFAKTLGDQFYNDVYGIKFVIVCPGITDTPFIDGISLRLYRQDTKAPTDKLKAHLAVQTPEACGRNLVEVMKTAPHGTVWMLDDSKIELVDIKNYWLPN